MTDNFSITEAAAEKILELGKDSQRLRIKVEGGGCSGFRYEYIFDHSKDEKDLIFSGNSGAEVVIDDLSITFVKDSVLDYVEDLGSAGFEIKNPQAKARCGCGSSFSI